MASGGSRIVERGFLWLEEGVNGARKRVQFFEPHRFLISLLQIQF